MTNRNYIFLAKIEDINKRDCVYYLDDTSFEFEYGHYFRGLMVCGASFCGFLEELKEEVNNNFDKVKTILTKEEFSELFKLHDEVKALGYGIEKDNDKYNKGLELCNKANELFEKLYTKENLDLFNEVIIEEKEWVKNEYSLSSEDVDVLFDNYGHGYSCDLGYRDRGIISTIFDDFDNMVYEEKFNFGYNDIPYFDDKAFGEDLLENSSYYKLPSGKIVYYSY